MQDHQEYLIPPLSLQLIKQESGRFKFKKNYDCGEKTIWNGVYNVG